VSALRSGLVLGIVVLALFDATGLVLTFEALLEGGHALTQRRTQLGQAAMTKKQNDDGENDQVPKTQSKHAMIHSTSVNLLSRCGKVSRSVLHSRLAVGAWLCCTRGMIRKLVVALALISTTTAFATTWNRNMQTLFQSLQELLVLTVDDAKFNDPKNTARIESAAEAMMKGAHDVSKMRGKSPDLDPSVGIFSALLQDESRRAYEAYKSGHKEYARSLFKNMASACVACHSRTAAGSRLQWDFSAGFAQGLSQYQQAELLAAGRSFDAALTALEKVLTDFEMAKKRPYDWNRALRFALAISIRMERDPAKALALLEKTSKTPGTPQFSKLDMQDWIRSLTAWKAEKASGAVEPSSEEGLNQEAKRLLGLARAAQRYPMDRAGDILYLRATSLLHQQLQVAPAGAKSSEAMLLLGLSYEVLRDFELWNLNEIYFEACIHRAPHTDTSETCYRKLEESVITGYTGSSGTDIPDGARKKLDSLRKMAAAPAIGKKVQ